MKCLVCDFGGSSVKHAVVDERANMEHVGKVPAPLKGGDAFVEAVCGLYQKYQDEVEGIALSLPGIVDSEQGIHHGSGVYGRFLNEKNIIRLLRDCCHVNVSVENDGKCGALAEVWNGALSGVKDGVVLILGTGIGGGVIINGTIHRGLNFSAGEFSYALSDTRDFGLLNEAWMSIGMAGMTYRTCKRKNLDLSVQDAGEVLEKYDKIFGDKFPKFEIAPQKIRVDGKQFFRWLEEGDPETAGVYSEFLSALAGLIHNIQVCCGPERVVIGGGLSRVERLLPDLQMEMEKLYAACAVPPAVRSVITRSKYLDECNLLGAMYRYLEQYGGN